MDGDTITRDWATFSEVCVMAQITPRQADYWTRTGLLVPQGDATPGHGHPRRYPAAEVRKAQAVKALLTAGLELPFIRQHIDEFISAGSHTAGPVTITYIPEQ